ncbi:SigE family RNA polymerase sigma factor [Streptomyces sp. NPDC101178]|uniref:SigE family RNA polymerase sigma factor n=1 Tax=Streptomyces sp. NPDC101178 TaxID=3366124 RepID=UPI0037F51217
MAQGEVLAFEDYVRTRQEALLRSARRLVPDPVDAQDLLQTALVRTYGRWDGIADKSLADAYLRRVMINTRTEWWRARKLDEVPTEQLPDASVDDGSEQRADRALLMDILGILAPKQRSVVVLRHWEQMSTEETAAALGMSVGTVKSTLHRALARLRQELESRELTSREAVARETGGRRETGGHREAEARREAMSARAAGGAPEAGSARTSGNQRRAGSVPETGNARRNGTVRSAAPAATGRVPAQRTRATAPSAATASTTVAVTSVTAARGHTAALRDGRHDERGRERCAA